MLAFVLWLTIKDCCTSHQVGLMRPCSSLLDIINIIVGCVKNGNEEVVPKKAEIAIRPADSKFEFYSHWHPVNALQQTYYYLSYFLKGIKKIKIKYEISLLDNTVYALSERLI